MGLHTKRSGAGIDLGNVSRTSCLVRGIWRPAAFIADFPQKNTQEFYMKKHTKLFSLIGTAFLAIAVVFAATSCKQNDDDKGSAPVATIKSSDGNATLTVLTYDKNTGKGTCKVDVPSQNYWVTGDFQATSTTVTLSNTKDSLGHTGTSALAGTYPITSKKVTINGFTFDLSPLFS